MEERLGGGGGLGMEEMESVLGVEKAQGPELKE